ncbi:MAG: hypothetical protein WAU23_06145 [Ferruginibacter sp.]
MGRKGIKQAVFIWVFLSCLSIQTRALPGHEQIKITRVTSTQQEAIAYLEGIKEPVYNKLWPNIKPALFFRNLRSTVGNPINIYPGMSTNFCGYGALTYLFLLDDPLGYAKLLVQLYNEGKASFRDVHFIPSDAVRKAAGSLKFKGILDIHPAEQMWYLTLAGHFKGYLNFFNRKYDPGDENKFWASVNYAKFNRMLKKLLGYQVNASGGDIFRPKTQDLYLYISKKMESGPVVIYINNRIVHKKNHVTIKLGVPTHYIVADKIENENGIVTLVYWDYGHRTQMQLSTAFFKRIVFGITDCTKSEADAE